jgi:hypothetical protein
MLVARNHSGQAVVPLWLSTRMVKSTSLCRPAAWLSRSARQQVAALVPFVSTCPDNRRMKLRRLRDGDDLDNDTVLVRGGELDRDLLLADARRYHLLYGTYGISLFAVRSLTIDEMAQQVPLVRFDRLTLITAWELASAGPRLEPTGRNPRHYTVGFDELERGVKAIVSCGRRVITNAYHDA